MNSLEKFAEGAVAPLPNERSSDAWVLKQMIEATNPVTRCVEKEILTKRIERIYLGEENVSG